MSRWTEPSPSDFDRWEALVANGKDPSSAARELGFNGSSTFKRASGERHAEVLALSREVREGVANDRGEKWALEDDAPPALRLAYLKAESPRYGDHSRLEISGPEGGAIALEGRAVVGLADVISLARQLGEGHRFGLDAGTPGEALPAAKDVLPDPALDQRAAGVLPADGR